MSEASPFEDAVVLAPLTVGGNLPFRRLCVELGAQVTFGEMAMVRKLLGGSPSEFALLKSHPDEPCFGVQLADSKPETPGRGGAARRVARRALRGPQLRLPDPRDHAARPGREPAAQARRGSGGWSRRWRRRCSVPVTVKLRVGWKEDEANVSQVARVCEESGAAAISIHGRTREQRYSRAADWETDRPRGGRALASR